MHTCGRSKYDCGEGNCIPREQFCDKVDDSGNNEDEDGCIRNGDSVYCDQCELACDNQTGCLVSWFVCDELNDCQYGSDEKYCPETKEALELRCDTGANRTSSENTTTTTKFASTTATPARVCKVENGDFPYLDGQ
ncbi:hypothetical protein MTO96_022983 [Rhipicephalus appendiculatus]